MSTVTKPTRCYYCNGILSEVDMVIKPVPLVCKNNKTRMYKRKFHLNCVQKFVNENQDQFKKEAEQNEWDKVYTYFKVKIMGKKPNETVSASMNKYMVQRLLGLRVGTFMPNATNVRTIKRGYSFQTILLTMKFTKIIIQKGFETRQFHDFKHQINFALLIISQHIDYIQKQINKRDEINKETEKIEFKTHTTAKYQNKGGKRKFDFV